MNKEALIPAIFYFAVISLITVTVTVCDKVKAKKGSFRVSEKSLILLALAGGSVAEYITMKAIRHKTLHKKFMIGLPVIMLIQLAVIFLLLYKIYFT